MKFKSFHIESHGPLISVTGWHSYRWAETPAPNTAGSPAAQETQEPCKMIRPTGGGQQRGCWKAKGPRNRPRKHPAVARSIRDPRAAQAPPGVQCELARWARGVSSCVLFLCISSRNQ